MPHPIVKTLISIAALAAAIIAQTGAADAALVDYAIVQHPTISPNNDGIKDFSLVRVGLLDTCAVLLLTVEDASSGTPLDTLLAAAGALPGVHSAEWRGENAAGGLLAEGGYTLRIFASDGSESESRTTTVIVDVTTPLVALDRIEPGIYTPGVAGAAEKVLIYFSISRSGPGDTMSVTITNPAAAKYDVPVGIDGDGVYSAEWSTSSTAVDSIYAVDLAITDEAGNSGAARGFFDVDTKGPRIAFLTSIPNPTNDPPLEIWGRCYDRNGIESDSLSWNGGPYFLPDSSYSIGDTVLVWRFDAVDSLAEGSGFREGRYTIKCKCRDRSGRESTISHTFRLDLTPPAAPVLDALPSSVYEAKLNLTGSVDGAGARFVHLYRVSGNDTDHTRKEIVARATAFFIPDTLDLGENVFRAAAQDSAGNMSASSAPRTVIYEIARGISHPEVFRAPDAFRVYTEREARKVEVKIFTVAGELVTTLPSSAPGTDFTLAWDLTTADGEVVRNGPYLVVITVFFDTDTRVEKRFIAVVR